MKKISILFLLLSFTACSIFNSTSRAPSSGPGGFSKGDGDIGNGGYGVVCYNKDKKTIKSVELLDIYEGRLKGYSFNRDEFNANDIHSFLGYAGILSARQQDANSFDLYSVSERYDYESLVGNIYRYKVVLEKGVDFDYQTSDAIPHFKEDNCKPKQIAMMKNDGRVYIIKKYWDMLDELNKVALIFHEAIYKVRREQYFETNSQNARDIVALLLLDYDKTQVKDTDKILRELLINQTELKKYKDKQEQRKEDKTLRGYMFENNFINSRRCNAEIVFFPGATKEFYHSKFNLSIDCNGKKASLFFTDCNLDSSRCSTPYGMYNGFELPPVTFTKKSWKSFELSFDNEDDAGLSNYSILKNKINVLLGEYVVYK